MTVTEELHRNYRVAFLRYLPRREEAPLREAYEIGRSAVVQGITILDLAELHHQMFLEVIQNTLKPSWLQSRQAHQNSSSRFSPPTT
jgi:Phosphoserine phosphatase RsbU, N-terminal domain